jgi:hypothetical protein
MVQLVRSTPLGVMLALLSGAACSAPDWPSVAGSSSGGASDSAEAPASNAGTVTGPAPDPPRTPPSVGQEGVGPISGGVSNLGGEADAGSVRPTTPLDAGLVPADASIVPPSTPEGPPEPEPEPACAGVRVGGVCWYLGAAELACDDVCASHGGFAPEGAAIVGTPAQGGSIEGCTAVLGALDALPAPVTTGFRNDGLGLGCHLFTNGSAVTTAWWLDAPDLSPAAAGDAVRIACSCVR